MKIFAVIMSIITLAGIGWAIYAGVVRPITKPNPNESQQADSIVNHNTYYQFTPHQTFGCAHYIAPQAPVEKKK